MCALLSGLYIGDDHEGGGEGGGGWGGGAVGLAKEGKNVSLKEDLLLKERMFLLLQQTPFQKGLGVQGRKLEVIKVIFLLQKGGTLPSVSNLVSYILSYE